MTHPGRETGRKSEPARADPDLSELTAQLKRYLGEATVDYGRAGS